MKFISSLSIVVFGFLLVYALWGLSAQDVSKGLGTSSAGTHSPEAFYIQNAYAVADTPNMVTVILADFRGIDTLGEETVIFAAGIICLLLLRRNRQHEKTQQ